MTITVKQKVFLYSMGFILVATVTFFYFRWNNESNEEIIKNTSDRTSVKVVKNTALGIEVSYDPEVIDATGNYDEETNDLYSPFMGFSSANVNVNIQSYDHLETFFELANTYSATPLDGFMSLTRYDHSGYSGYKMWKWGIQTPEPQSHIIYRFHRGADILEVDGSIVATDPTSQAFKNSEKILDDLVENIVFINGSGKDITEVAQTIPSIIDLAIFSEHSPTSARIADKIPSEKEKLTSTVNNEDLGISVNYDSEAFKLVSNVSDETWGGPSLMLESKDIRLMFGIGLKEHFDKIEVFPSTVPLSSMMAITRYDHSGYAGKRTWRWFIHNQQPTRTSSIDYMFYRGSDVLNISANINEQDPRSDHFRELVDQADTMILNMVFIGEENQEYRSIERNIISKIDNGVFNNKE